MILAIVGPTGVGKTKLSVLLAKEYNALIINCDAMQFYKDLNIGTAKIKEEEKQGIPHLLFDICDLTDEYSIYNYQRDARKLLEEYKGRNIIFVGGSGLYLKAALHNYTLHDENNNKNDYSAYTNDELYKMALLKDPELKIHKNNRTRLERFLDKERISVDNPYKLYDYTLIGLTTDRSKLYEIIDLRVEKMFEDGLLEEVKKLYDSNIKSKAINRAIGYKELYEYFDGKITFAEAVDKIKKNSRHYAKRQYTFFNNQLDVKWFNVNYDNFEETIKEVKNFINYK